MQASKSSVFRKMFETEAKEKLDAEMNKRLRHVQHGNDQEHSAEAKLRHHQLKHGDGQEPHHIKHGDEEEEEEESAEPGVFHLEDIPSAVLRAGINFLYTAEIHFTEKVKPLEVMRFAHEYDVPWLKKVCEQELARSITVKNLSEILRLSYRWQAEHLKKAARKFFEEHPEFHNDVLDALLTSG